jgi:hypothetical protein
MQRAIYSFQRAVPFVFWRDPYMTPSEEVTGAFQEDLDALIAAGQYEGRQWINADYRSFDLQSPDLAVVAVRETWEGTLYELGEGGYPEEGDAVAGRRGPYTLDVVYTVERGEDGWQVTKVVFENEPPAWEEE